MLKALQLAQLEQGKKHESYSFGAESSVPNNSRIASQRSGLIPFCHSVTCAGSWSTGCKRICQTNSVMSNRSRRPRLLFKRLRNRCEAIVASETSSQRLLFKRLRSNRRNYRELKSLSCVKGAIWLLVFPRAGEEASAEHAEHPARDRSTERRRHRHTIAGRWSASSFCIRTVAAETSCPAASHSRSDFVTVSLYIENF